MVKWLPITSVSNWDKNPRAITKTEYERLIKQIKRAFEILGERDGQFKPLIIDQNNIVIGGNMRLRAFNKLGVKEVWVNQLVFKDEAERLSIALLDNDRAGYYVEQELLELVSQMPEIDWQDYRIDLGKTVSIADLLAELTGDIDKYTDKIDGLIYEPSDKRPEINELYDRSKSDQLTSLVDTLDIPDTDKEFLRAAATRHYVFTYSKIADYYAQATPAVKEVMEAMALVIIDYDKAIENGFVRLTKELGKIRDREEQNEG